ncbi:MAG: serine/threonine protein kinase [Deltaproteobacteria bacterium]|nr:serine/threonine protein kinase [Deltaproteobacteria bacterium]
MSYPKIDRYEIRLGLGRGAMGSVYLAFDTKLQREVALKVLQKEFAENPKYRTRFEREAHAIALLKHPNIVEIYDYGGSPEAYLFLVMELVRGPHVGKLVREQAPLPESVIAAIGHELTAALAAAHAAGVIHRDLKPENVFIDRGRLVLADFGIVKAIAPDTALGPAAAAIRTDIVGTPGFMAPEQLLQEPLDPRADLFSLGSLLYYLASMKLPFEADSPYGLLQEFKDKTPAPLASLRPDLSPELCALVHRSLQVKRERRPKSAEEVRQALRGVLDGIGERDVRDLLARFEADPAATRVRDRARTLAHLAEQAKIAGRDHDDKQMELVRRRIRALDPTQAETDAVVPVDTVVDRTAASTPQRRGRRRVAWLRWAAPAATLVITVLAGLLALWLTRPAPSPPEPAPVVTPAPAILEVRTKHRTRVLLAGTEIGSAPGFVPTPIPAGACELELISDRFGKLKEPLAAPPGGRVVVTIDWKRRRVKVASE